MLYCDILKMNGIKKEDTQIKLETIFSGYNGNTIKIITTHLIL